VKFNLSFPSEVRQARDQLDYLIAKKKLVEIRPIKQTRTLNQNSYLHLLLGYFGQHFGYTLEESKQIYKKLNHSIYAYSKNNTVFWKSSADITVDEMTDSIELFRTKSANEGCPLPPATDQGWLREIEREIERSESYLKNKNQTR
jgi:hypothetical protein